MKKWIAILIVFFVLAALGLTGLVFSKTLTGRVSGKPEVILVQPSEQTTIQNTEGVLFIVMGRSGKAIDRIEFRENGNLAGKHYPVNFGSKEIAAQFAWVPESVGVYELTFTAFDSDNAESDPAAITIGVISDGLSQATVDQTIATVSNALPKNTASGASSGGSGSGIGAAANVVEGGAENQGEDAGVDIGFEENQGVEPGVDVGFEENPDNPEMQFIQVDADINRIRPLANDMPPVITAFETSLQREGAGVNVTVSATAQDDFGVETLYIVTYSDFNQEMPIQLAQACNGDTVCSATVSAFLREATYQLFVTAEDTIGQASESEFKLIEVAAENQAGENPGIAEDAANQILSPEFINNLLIRGNGIFGLAPFPLFGLGAVNPEPDLPDCQPNCPVSSITDVRVEVDQYYDSAWVPYIHVKMIIPPKLETDLANPFISLENDDIFLWNLDNKLFTYLTPDVYENGLVLETSKPMYYGRHPMQQIYLANCGNQTYTFTPEMQPSGGNRSSIVYGTSTEFTSLPCPPMRYLLANLVVRTDCPNNAERCINIGYQIINDDELVSLPVDQLVLKEKRLRWGQIQEREYTPPRFGVMVFQQPDDIQENDVYEYELSGISNEYGVLYSSRLNIRILEGEQGMYWIDDWQESR